MSEAATPSSRTLTVVLSETEWRALRDIEPDAVGWLQERIRERLGSAGYQHSAKTQNTMPTAMSATSWGDDEY